ncbi:MAG TPA: hypothetical protein VMD30_08145 [Tepidisphaeraceae bacterium]|nr:hypothetical protein [Tepidisphaeraceae bacterium]
MQLNPVFSKDLRSLLRLKTLAAIEIIYFLAVAFLVKTVPADKTSLLLTGLILGQLALFALVVPAVASASLAVEKESQTLEMLTSSRLSSWQILSGKALAAASFPAILIFCSCPFVIFLALRDGMAAPTIGLIYLILVLAAGMISLICLAASTFCRQTATALVLGYLLTILICAGALAPPCAGLGGAVTHHAAALSPIAAELSILRPDLPEDYSGIRSDRAPADLLFLPLSLAVIVASVGLAVLRLDRPAAETPAPLSRSAWIVRIFFSLLIVSLLMALLARFAMTGDPARLTRIAQFLVALQIGAAAAVSTGIAAASVTTEIERETLEMLRASRQSDDLIFWSKLLPAILSGWITIPAMAPAYLLLTYFSPDYAPWFLRLIPLAAGAALLGSVMGMTCSCFFRATARSTVAAFTIMACLILLPLVARLGQRSGLMDFGPWTDKAVLTSPLVIGLGLHPNPNPLILDIWPRHLLWITVFSVCWLLVARLKLAQRLRNG